MRTFAEIAREIRLTWTNMNACAREYQRAMACIYSTDKLAPYLFEDAQGIVLGFLNNAQGWRGDDARRIKAELKSMIA